MKAKYIDLDNLAIAIKEMTYQQGFFKTIKRELSARGYWKNLKRGNPQKGFKAMKEKKS